MKEQLTAQEREELEGMDYYARVAWFTQQWVEVRCLHNDFDSECLPDFSCCMPDLFTTSTEERALDYERLLGLILAQEKDT